jgi:hypothetical protein
MTPPVTVKEFVRVRNASSVGQVNEAKLREKLAEDNEMARLKGLLAMPEFRREMWLLLGATHVFDSIFVSSSEIYYRSGQQDVGHWLMQRIAAADPEAYVLMQREAAALTAQDVIPPDTRPDHSGDA